MTTEVVVSYLSNMEEFIFEEKKIVTYAWLSSALGIHSNLSKKLLHTFYEQSPRKEELSVTYLLIGSPRIEEKCVVSIVKDKDLEEYEKDLKTITSKHIYSIQKCTDLPDVSVLHAAQKGEPDDIISKGISAIYFNCNERDSVKLTKLRSEALPTVSKQPAGLVKKGVLQTSPKPKSPEKKTSINDEDKSKSLNSVKDTTSKPEENEKSNIPSMFRNDKPAQNKTEIKNKSSGKVSSNNKIPQQSIGAFFVKATEKQNTKSEESVESEKGKEEKKSDNEKRLSSLKENKATLNIVKGSSLKLSETFQKTSPKTKKIQTNRKTAVKKANKEGKAKINENEQKKRKRLVVISESESENSSEVEEEVMREPTPEPMVVPDDEDVIPATPESTSRKRKKLIYKTYTTPDGYLETEKQYIDVSGSEGEVEEGVSEKKYKDSSPQKATNPIKPHEIKPVQQSETTVNSSVSIKSSSVQNKHQSKSKTASPQKTKQASLMSFFKKS